MQGSLEKLWEAVSRAVTHTLANILLISQGQTMEFLIKSNLFPKSDMTSIMLKGLFMPNVGSYPTYINSSWMTKGGKSIYFFFFSVYLLDDKNKRKPSMIFNKHINLKQGRSDILISDYKSIFIKLNLVWQMALIVGNYSFYVVYPLETLADHGSPQLLAFAALRNYFLPFIYPCSVIYSQKLIM